MKALKDSVRHTKEVRFSELPAEGARRHSDSRLPAPRNAVEETSDLYGVQNWGSEYFDVNLAGEVVVKFEATRETPVPLIDIIEQLRQRGVSTPVVLRFPQILDYQIKKLVGAFRSAMQEFAYRRDYIPVYPIKVNQKKEVVQAVLGFGERYNLGLEVGSKAELMIALALTRRRESPIICNGVKDDAYLRLALMGKQLGKTVFVVLESLFELRLLLELSKRLKIRPLIGLRLKLSARGSGKWEKSSGDLSKFGFTTPDLLRCLQLLHQERLIDCLHLLHFHIGSQVTDIKRIKYAVKEAARTYAKLRKLCPNLDYLDVGGGLGLDYDGSRTASESSVNYSVQEYANDIIYSIKEVCDNENVHEPIVITENGRMIAGPHAVLVFNVVNELALTNGPIRVDNIESKPQVIQEMYDLYTGINGKNYREYYHDVLEQRDEMFSLFNLGYLSLEDRGLGQELFWGVCERALKYAKMAKHMPEEFEDVERLLSRKFICNFSVFQSIPDAWAIDQLFPILPIHRLNEIPDRKGYLADLTCDSDGKVDNFIDLRDIKESLELHALNGKPYYLGVFFTGAYQDVMGDYHNLFGHVHDVLVVADGKGSCHITKIIPGHRIEGVLRVFGYEREEMVAEFRQRVAEGVAREGLKPEWGNSLVREYEAALGSYTYLALD
ncbi:MAG: biosynthetic arginine decarboxylase [Candidatus Binatia bacterium]|nr:biosynthetic arginine decarboxylase [Candidatus Binatia bacterium]